MTDKNEKKPLEKDKQKNIKKIDKNIKKGTKIIELNKEKKEEISLRERTRIFFNDLRIKFKNLFSPEDGIKYLPEYYDLPYKYDEDTVKILAQTPHKLFVYWNISDESKMEITQKYGQDFWDKSYPVLIVRNTTKNYSFEIKINDFANSWYIDIPDNSSLYNVVIGRKLFNDFSYSSNIQFIPEENELDISSKSTKDELTSSPLNVSTYTNKDFAEEDFEENLVHLPKDTFIEFGKSNDLESPNGHILTGTIQEYMAFRDFNTGNVVYLNNFSKKNMANIYDAEDINDSSSKKFMGSSWMVSSSNMKGI